MTFFTFNSNTVSNIKIQATTPYMKQELIPSSVNHYMVGFVHSLHMQSDLNPKKKVHHPFSGDGVFF
jgi:hypothetical protein